MPDESGSLVQLAGTRFGLLQPLLYAGVSPSADVPDGTALPSRLRAGASSEHPWRRGPARFWTPAPCSD
jgi:hypothetical protein